MFNILKKTGLIHSDFEEIFFRNEYHALAGANKRTILALVAILFLTFVALGVAVGGLENLDKKMNNPFSNWVNVDVTNKVSDVGGPVKDRFSRPEVMDSFHLKNTNGFARYTLDFYEKSYDPFRHETNAQFWRKWGRTVEPGEVMLGSIFSEKNLVWPVKGIDPDSLDECSIVVTESLLELLKFKVPASDDVTLFLPLKDDDKYGHTRLVMLQVAAVVKELPGLNNFFLTFPKLHNILMSQIVDGTDCADLVIYNSGRESRYLLLTDNPASLGVLDSLAKAHFKTNLYVDPDHDGSSYPRETGAWFRYIISFPPGSIDTFAFRSFLAVARKTINLAEFAKLTCGTDDCTMLDPGEYNNLAFHFEKLELIREFRKELLGTYGIEMDMTQVESKENFWLVSRLTFIISLILLMFGVLSIVLFVNNILKNHLFSIRSNLGTFQAFGLNNSFLVGIYLKIIFSFLIISIAAAYALAVVVDRAEQLLRGEDSLFNIFSVWVLGAVVGLVAISLLLTVTTIRRILNNTPGNLIYER